MADVYRPADGGPHPAVMCFTPYGKDIHFSVIDKSVTKEYAVYEAPDITRWVADEYAVVIVDAAWPRHVARRNRRVVTAGHRRLPRHHRIHR